jgi:hypothetical protein
VVSRVSWERNRRSARGRGGRQPGESGESGESGEPQRDHKKAAVETPPGDSGHFLPSAARREFTDTFHGTGFNENLARAP